MEVVTNGVRLWVEQFGSVDDPAVLLVSGADSPCARWTPAFVDPLVDAGFRVVRYDLRDVGRSQVMAHDEPYRLADLADDAVGVLDHLGVERAHVVGRSMGAMIGQVLALDHADRVASLTLVSSTPGLGDERLSSAHDAIVDALAERLFEPPPRDPDACARWVVDGYRIFNGPRFAFDEGGQQQQAEAEVVVAWRPETGHGVAVNVSPTRLDRLGQIAVPTLIVHGDRDGVFPIDHAEALHTGIAGSELWVVEGLGHELPDALAPEFTDRLLGFLPASPDPA
ncbi:MAG: alpha/beta fold hydrolase [Acidimicrobiales bacterium]